MGYARTGQLRISNSDGTQARQATAQETESFINQHPYDLSGYAELQLTARRIQKDKDREKNNELKFRGFGF